MWYKIRVYVGDWSTEEWFPRVPVVGDLVDVGRGEVRVSMVQLRSWDGTPLERVIVAIVHTD